MLKRIQVPWCQKSLGPETLLKRNAALSVERFAVHKERSRHWGLWHRCNLPLQGKVRKPRDERRQA